MLLPPSTLIHVLVAGNSILKCGKITKLWVGLAVILILSSCTEIRKNKVDSITFSYTTFVKENEDGKPEAFKADEYVVYDDSNLGFFRGNIWTEVLLTNNGNQRKSIVIGNKDKLCYNYTLYQKDPATENLILVNGLPEPGYTDGRSFQFPQPNFRIELEPNTSIQYYIHSTSDGRVVQQTPFITSLEDYLVLMSRETSVNGFFYGSLFIILLFNLFFWRSFKNKIHIYYSLYIFFTLLLYLGFDGYLYGKGVHNHLVDHFIFLILRGMLLSLIFFTISYLKFDLSTHRFSSWIKRTMIVVMIALTVYQLLFFNSSISQLHHFENMISCGWIFLILIMLIISLKRKRPEVKYYLTGLFIYLSFVIFGEINPYIEYFDSFRIEFNLFYKLGTAFEVIIFTYTIIRVIGINEKSIIEKNKIYLEDKGHVESENKTLKAQINDSNMQKMEFLAILKLIESNLKDEEEWNLFKDKVNDVNPNFLSKLRLKNKTLTKNDLRLLLLVKIGFTQKEISNMLFIAESSVKKSKQRVRKKLKLPSDITLTAFLSEF